MSDTATLPPQEALKPAREMAEAEHHPLGRRERRLSPGADRSARRGDRAAPPDPARRRAAPRAAAGPGREGLSLPRRAGQRDRPDRPVRPARHAVRLFLDVRARARAALPDVHLVRRLARHSRARHRAAHRARDRRPLAGRAPARLRPRARLAEPQILPDGRRRLRPRRPCADRRRRRRGADGLAARRRQGPPVLGAPRAAWRPPIPASIRTSRPIRRRSGTSST